MLSHDGLLFHYNITCLFYPGFYSVYYIGMMPRLFRGHVPYWGAPLLLKKRQSVKKINPHVLKNVIIQTMSSGSTLGGGGRVQSFEVEFLHPPSVHRKLELIS